MNFYDPKTAPDVFDLVWCKWPKREDRDGRPGPWVRAVLVLDTRLMTDEDGTEWAAITAAYGTGADNVGEEGQKDNLLVSGAEFRSLGLHKPTVFKLDLGNRKRLPWAEEYFVTQGYVLNQKLICGRLTDSQQTTVKACLKARSLVFPLP